MRNTFIDSGADAQFRELGYVVADLLDGERLDAAREFVNRVYRGDRHGMHTTIQSPDTEYRRTVIDELPGLIAPLLDPVLDDHVDIMSSLLIKWSGDDTAFVTHQDWSMVDERRFRSVNVWIPLIDVDESNGALAVLPRSHRYLDHLRCCPMNPFDFASESGAVTCDEMDSVPIRAGQAIYFDNGLLHGSTPNVSGAPRAAIVVMMKPREADTLHFYLPDADSWTAERYVVDREFFADYVIGERPHYPPDGVEDFYGTARSKHDLLDFCRRGQPLGQAE